MRDITHNRSRSVRYLAGLLSLSPLVALLITAPFLAHASDQPAIAEAVGADVGTGWNILQIPASAFQSRTPSVQAYTNAEGYTFAEGFSNGWFYAPVFLPSGAAIGYLNLYAYDTGPSAVVAEIRRYTGYGLDPLCTGVCFLVAPGSSQVTSVSSIGSTGYQYLSSTELTPSHTVNNNVRYGGGAQYVAGVYLPGLTLYAFKGVDIWWKRQIAPAPGTARFTDVPLGAQFFAEIEALAASGITLGCTATTFCPNATLTRAQMAAFLARALGLYFPY